MSKKSLKEKVFSGVLWSMGERVFAQLIALVIQIVLARILMPEEYGVIAIALVFISLSNVIATSGLSMSLIQKKDADDLDFSSAFYLNLVFGLVLFAIVYFTAPQIGDFYGNPLITDVLRVLGISIPFSAIVSVQKSYVSRKMLFRRFFVSTLIGNTAAGILGIIAAFSGWGVWALVVQSISTVVFDLVILLITVEWRPKLLFSIGRTKELYSFGWKVLVSNLVYEFFRQLRSLVIGKAYSAEDLAYYNRGEVFPSLISVNMDTSLQTALFPAMSQLQDDVDKLRDVLKKSVTVGCFVVFPLMAGLAAVAEPLISVLLTDKWLPAVPFVWFFCIAYSMQTLQSANLQAIRAVGKSDITLIQDIVKRVFDIVLLIIAIPFGVYAIALAAVIGSVFSTIVNALPCKKMFGYGFFHQIKDIIPSLVIAVLMGVVVWSISLLGIPILPQLFIQIIVGIVVYVVLARIAKIESLNYISDIIRGYIPKKEK